jgi:ATP-dependent DNA helicase RecQ
MADQVANLEQKNITATYINSSLSKKQIEQRLIKLERQQFKFLYLAPERLKNSNIKQLCQKIKINQIAVDEAHCVSIWGHDFRPSYLEIKKFITFLKKRPVVTAFTATATPTVQQDIVACLGLNKPKIHTNQSLRTNLKLHSETCCTKGEKEVKLAKILKTHQGQAGIIYTATRKSAAYLSAWINHLNIDEKLCQTKTHYYHGALKETDKNQVQDRFISNQTDLICATNAFGMGIDKADIRFVVHFQLPGSLENYYQEIGRAGRDGQLSNCYLLFCPDDIQIQTGFIQNLKQADRQKLKLNKLKKMVEFCTQSNCLNLKLAQYFQLSYDHDQYPVCNYCSQTKLSLNQQEKQIYQKLNQFHKLPAQTKYLLAIIQPNQKKDLQKIPGIGDNLKKLFWNN